MRATDEATLRAMLDWLLVEADWEGHGHDDGVHKQTERIVRYVMHGDDDE